MVEFGDSIIGIGTQGAHGAFSPKTAGTASQYISVYIDDIDAHYQRAREAGAQIASALHDHLHGAIAPTRRSTSKATAGASVQRMREVPR